MMDMPLLFISSTSTMVHGLALWFEVLLDGRYHSSHIFYTFFIYNFTPHFVLFLTAWTKDG